ncbi:MAG: class I SAM-dependent methyltransferase [Thaumarchaeota archaeon]|nr:class I SAM-dependent methyltransferase [Nitrososphaerota archaeon]
MDVHTKANLKMWNRMVPINAKSKMYDVAGFKSGKSSLSPHEIRELRPIVKGKSVLHLQCHFGMDTLSIARLGASKVAGVDFSPVAISLARKLAKQVGLDKRSEFVCSDIYSIPAGFRKKKFDVVYTGGGALFWLKDLERWGRIVSGFLRPGGVLYIKGFHPFSNSFDEEASEPRLRYPYFHRKEPIINKFHGTYSEPGADFESEEHNWSFGMGELVNVLVGAGLTIDYLHEFMTVGYKRFQFLVKGRDDRWGWKDPNAGVPLVFSLRATKQKG